jgi:hypothetical protein
VSHFLEGKEPAEICDQESGGEDQDRAFAEVLHGNTSRLCAEVSWIFAYPSVTTVTVLEIFTALSAGRQRGVATRRAIS